MDAPAPVECGRYSVSRANGLIVVKPIVYGNTARYLGEDSDPSKTHEWTAYLRSYKDEDMSAFIKEVRFNLHASFTDPIRIFTKPPYELTEQGWGEFEMNIEIHFKDPKEKPILIYHFLRLYPSDQSDKQLFIPAPPGEEIISENYDEIIFKDPTRLMIQLLESVKPLNNVNYLHYTDFKTKEANTLKAVLAAKELVKSEIEELKIKFTLAQDTIKKFKKVQKMAKVLKK